jgi:hypothetical protein
LGHLLNEFIEVYYDAKNITEGLTGQYNPITKSYELRTKDTTPNTLRALWVGSKEFQVFHWLITNLISKAEEKVRLQNPNLNLLDSPNEYWAAIQLEIANTDEDEIIKNLNNWSHNYALNYPNPLSSGYNDVVNKIIIPDIMVVYKAHLPVLRNISAKINPKTGKFDFVKKK